MGLNLYSKIEPYLDFQDEVYNLHNEFMSIVFDNELDNILDVGCGQGFFIESLNLNQKNAYGIDLSSEQIDACKQRGVENVACIDLKDVKEKYECATAIFDVINYIPKDSLKEFFENVYKALNDKGYFIFDVNTLYGFEEIAQGCITMDLDDKFIAIDAIYEDEKLVTDLTLFTKLEDGNFKKENDFITQYYHSKDRLKKMLKKIGFEVESLRDFNLHSDERADKQIYICTK
ncbi:methyltransferase [Arcobacter sp. CECT 8989]|uniref:class I SAM-dependent DNA methyltransferase n=1 Tax=Arcobacter sp. CECT 8989 TaxID=2044509 RepID=UPI00100C151C|nr:class I SAM-dependent methyltransferase [Arcobacter sp. CECT 8989]RXK00628.1 methyltransferase [Arcobacter sp. CECT 8989]